MIDKTHPPRKIRFSIERLEPLLAAALEHSAHGWSALEKEISVNRLNPDSWPPQVEAEVGSSQYHLSIVLTLVYEAYSAIREEQEHTEAVAEKVDRYLRENGKL